MRLLLTNESLSFLNNFCYSNPGAQIFLVQDLAIHRKLVPVAVKLCSQLLIDVKRSLMVTITNLLSFLTTLTADCPAAVKVVRKLSRFVMVTMRLLLTSIPM